MELRGDTLDNSMNGSRLDHLAKPTFSCSEKVENSFQEDTHRPAQSLERPRQIHHLLYCIFQR